MSKPVRSLPEDGLEEQAGRSSEALSAGPRQRLQILRRYRRIAMVGISANPQRPSHFVGLYLANRGYDIVPVNPNATDVLGRECFPSLGAVPGPVEVVDIFRKPEFVPDIVEEAIAVGAKVIWMQFGIVHEEAARRARQAGLEVVMDLCMKVEHARFSGGLSAMGLNSGVTSSRSSDPESGRHV